MMQIINMQQKTLAVKYFYYGKYCACLQICNSTDKNPLIKKITSISLLWKRIAFGASEFWLGKRQPVFKKNILEF